MVLRVLGWVFAITGTALIVVGIVDRSQGSTTVITYCATGGGFLLTGLLFIGMAEASALKDREKAAVLATGLAGTATITEFRRTSFSVDDNPRCEITVNVALPERLIYQATITEIIQEAALPRHALGAVFPCRVKQDDLSFVVLIADPGPSRVIAAEEIAYGVTGAATVLGTFTPPPTIDSGAPQYGLQLRVEIADGRPPYEVRLATTRPPDQPEPRRGTRIPVTVDPEDPRKISVNWPAPLT